MLPLCSLVSASYAVPASVSGMCFLAVLLGAFTALSAEPVTQQEDAQRANADKSGYTLFNPTPRSLMRELSTDRPDRTESPYTVDAGHFQLEMDILSYFYDRNTPARDGVRSELLAIAPMNLKAGLLNNVDLQLVILPYVSER